MIVVEGPDGAGKTTLIKKLVNVLEFEVAPRASDSSTGPIQGLCAWVERDLLQPAANHDGLIYDRHPLISQFIYDVALGRYPREAFDSVDWVCQAMNQFLSANPYLIICLPPINTVRDNIHHNHAPETHHLRGVLENIDRLYWGYHYRMADLASLIPHVWHWDYTKPDWGEMIQDIGNYITGRTD